MKEIDLAYRTMFAELGQRSLDGSFETDFPVGGRFVKVPVKGRSYWYFDLPVQGKVTRSYVGPQSDSEITKRVEAFAEIKNDLRARRKLVSTLTREAGLPAPERFTGDVCRQWPTPGCSACEGSWSGQSLFSAIKAC